MARHHDTIEILVTARHLEAQGIRPTARMVRLAMGGGSNAAIAQALAMAELTPLEELIRRRRDQLDLDITNARRALAELEAEQVRLDELAESLSGLDKG
ncbi:DNA-binding protein [Azospirillum isscasi]|uniref:DNA-binding protein n=1 Tax=Azospirillum isscasi TaxID=3053926 RepID=A0ABU0WEK6_9PROT|nr:DNA-binding protein [Azospirillum isscasi]MDQ2102337.1 DNA-binding protein [Azospirillum isscasi]